MRKVLSYPDIVIAGYMESGTTALYEYLSEHPKVIRTKVKETNHLDCGWQYGLQYYRKKLNFKKKKQDNSLMTLDATPNYVFHPLVPKRLYKLNPNAKVIICLRHPADRSLAQIWKYRGGDWQSAFQDEKIQFTFNPIRVMITVGHLKGGVPDYILYQKYFLELSRYINHVPRWLTVFGNDNVLLIDSAKMKKDVQGTMDMVHKFVGLEPHKVTKKLHNVSKNTMRWELHAVLRDELAKYFAPFNDRLNEYLEKIRYPYRFDWDEGLSEEDPEYDKLGFVPSVDMFGGVKTHT